MSEEQKTIDNLWPVACALACHVQDWHQPNHSGADAKWFSGPHFNRQSYQAAAFVEPGTIEYRINHSADVRITGIDVTGVRPEDVTVGPIEKLEPQRVVKADVLTNRNHSLDDSPWNLTYRDLEATTMAETVAKEVGASITAGLRQQIGYGSEIAQIQGETEISLQVEASVKAAWETAMTSHREIEVTSERDIILRAMHQGTLERVQTVGPARQVITARGALKYGFRFHSSGHWWVAFDSIQDLAAILQGFQASGHSSNDGSSWHEFYHKHPVPTGQLAALRQTVYATHTKVREFQNVGNVEVDIRSDPLNDEARLKDALKLVALKYPALKDQMEQELELLEAA